jgi:peroxiredoxin
MPKVHLNTPAPDFTLNNLKDEPVHLADFRGRKNLVLVFNRGFL